MEYYWNKKISLMPSEVDMYDFLNAMMDNRETVNFLRSISIDEIDLAEVFAFACAVIDYTIILLDEDGDYQYDMNEKDRKVQKFIREYRKDTNKKNRWGLQV
jgi:hypothetical protein